jgi:MOSC domain-containing protein YiiM
MVLEERGDRGVVTAVCVGQPRTLVVGRREVSTAIDKRPVHDPVEATPTGLVGDTVGDVDNHGGPDQALYAYAEHDADHWTAQLERDIPPGAFGRTCGSVTWPSPTPSSAPGGRSGARSSR